MAGHDRSITRLLAKRLRVEPRTLEALLDAPYKNYRTQYRSKDGGTRRRLRVPNELLKGVQKKILKAFLTGIDAHRANHCRSQRSVITSAKRHLGHKWIMAQDIKKCFPSTTPAMVRRALKRFDVEQQFVQPLTRLCTLSNQLPQGAPTSPALVSGVLRPIDDILSAEAEQQGLTYTRYVDDLFVSGNRQFPKYEQLLRRTVEGAGFELADGKRRVWGPNRPATLAGVLLATTELRPPDEFMRSVTRVVDDVEERVHVPNAEEVEKLRGQIAWIQAISSSAGKRLQSRLSEALQRHG